jgi:sarcosine oxidase
VTLDADVAVVGLGAFGSAALWRLAERGVRVVGIEQYVPGHDRGSSHGQSRVIRTAYAEDPRYVPLVREAFGLWRELEAKTATSLLTMTGALMIGPAGCPLVEGTLASVREHALAHDVLDAAAVRSRFPQHVVADDEVAIHETGAGVLRPEDGVITAVAAAEQAGAQLRTGVRASGIDDEGDAVVVHTDAGELRVAQVAVTVGPWLPQLVPTYAAALRVERQVQLWFRPRELASYAPDVFPVFIHETAPGHHCYGIPAVDGATVKVAVHHGGETTTADTVDRTVHPADVDPVARFVRERLVGLDPDPVRGAVCLYTNTPDEHFAVGRLPGHRRVVVLGGCSGHGYKFAPVLGDIAADLLTSGTTTRPVDLFDPARLVAMPDRGGGP